MGFFFCWQLIFYFIFFRVNLLAIDLIKNNGLQKNVPRKSAANDGHVVKSVRKFRGQAVIGLVWTLVHFNFQAEKALGCLVF